MDNTDRSIWCSMSKAPLKSNSISSDGRCDCVVNVVVDCQHNCYGMERPACRLMDRQDVARVTVGSKSAGNNTLDEFRACWIWVGNS